jgi:ribosomal protein L1
MYEKQNNLLLKMSSMGRLFPRGFVREVRDEHRYTAEEAIRRIRGKIENPHYLNSSYVLTTNLNLTPPKPCDRFGKTGIRGHKLRGVFDLPYSTGRKLRVAALTVDDALTDAAIEAGALYAGEFSLQVKSGKIKLSNVQRLVATDDMQGMCRNPKFTLAKKLQQHNLRPSFIDRTLVDPNDFVEAVRKHAHGHFVKFSISRQGQISVPIGKILDAKVEEISENLQAVLRQVYAIQPKHFEAGRQIKEENKGKYVLDLHLSANGVPGSLCLNLSQTLRSIDDSGL